MKIRQGFVSNSSSSSFVAVGLKIPKIALNDEMWRVSNKVGYNIYNDGEDGYESDTHFVIGREIALEDDGYMESEEVTQEEMDKMTDEIKEKFNVDGEVIIIAGTRMS